MFVEKGRRIAAAAAPARVLGLVRSDVVDDDPSVIASGPVSPDITTDAEALAVLERYGLEAPAVRNYLGSEREKSKGAGADAEWTDVRLIASSRKVFFGTEAAAADMIKHEEPGAIVNIASISSILAQHGQVQYDSTKDAVQMITRGRPSSSPSTGSGSTTWRPVRSRRSSPRAGARRPGTFPAN